MTLMLYVGNKRHSSWSLRPYLALAHTGLAFETRTILLAREATKAEILKVNPAGHVPVLHHDDLVIWDSLAICEYVNELAPEAQLWPAERVPRARARAICAEMHSGFTGLRSNMSMDILADKAGQGHVPEALADARRIFAIWHEALAASGGPFLFGHFTIADAMYAPVTTRFTTYGVELDATCRAYVETIAALPSMQAWRRDAMTEPVAHPSSATPAKPAAPKKRPTPVKPAAPKKRPARAKAAAPKKRPARAKAADQRQPGKARVTRRRPRRPT